MATEKQMEAQALFTVTNIEIHPRNIPEDKAENFTAEAHVEFCHGVITLRFIRIHDYDNGKMWVNYPNECGRWNKNRQDRHPNFLVQEPLWGDIIKMIETKYKRHYKEDFTLAPPR